MIFRRRGRAEEVDEEEQEMELVLFQGALNGKDANLAANARLAQAGLIPSKELVSDALSRRAETLVLEPKGNAAVLRLIVDGVPYPGGRMHPQQALAITQMLKLLAGLDIKERSKPQKGGIKAEFQETPYRLTVESLPVKPKGERLVVRAQNLKEQLLTPDDLGFPEAMREKIRAATSQKEGLVLVCGPPGSGTTTTTVAVVRTIDAYVHTIYALADLGHLELTNITPFETEEGADLETTLTRIVRVEADIVYIDPITDAKTAETIFKFRSKLSFVAETQAPDAAQAIVQMLKWIGDPKKVGEGLPLVISQRLIRVLCEKCKEAFRPNPKLLAKVGLPPESKVLFRPPRPPHPDDPAAAEYEPCPHCGGLGYKGRAGMFEVIEMTDALRKLLASGPSAQEVRALARQEKMQTFQREGLRLVAEGKTSLEELQRVFRKK